MVNVLSKVNVNDKHIETLASELRREVINYVRDKNDAEFKAYEDSVKSQMKQYDKDLKAFEELERSKVVLKDELGYYQTKDEVERALKQAEFYAKDELNRCVEAMTTCKRYKLDSRVTKQFIQKELLLSNSKSLKTAYNNVYKDLVNNYVTSSVTTGSPSYDYFYGCE
jgi:hypothetical protein